MNQRKPKLAGPPTASLSAAGDSAGTTANATPANMPANSSVVAIDGVLVPARKNSTRSLSIFTTSPSPHGRGSDGFGAAEAVGRAGDSNTMQGCGKAASPGTSTASASAWNPAARTASIIVSVVCGGGNAAWTRAASKGVRCRLQTLPTAQITSNGASTGSSAAMRR